MEVLFWLSVCGVIYPYFGYPALLWVLGTLTGARRGDGAAAADLPTVSMIIPVHNEASRLERKVANTGLAYPPDRWKSCSSRTAPRMTPCAAPVARLAGDARPRLAGGAGKARR